MGYHHRKIRTGKRELERTQKALTVFEELDRLGLRLTDEAVMLIGNDSEESKEASKAPVKRKRNRWEEIRPVTTAVFDEHLQRVQRLREDELNNVSEGSSATEATKNAKGEGVAHSIFFISDLPDSKPQSFDRIGQENQAIMVESVELEVDPWKDMMQEFKTLSLRETTVTPPDDDGALPGLSDMVGASARSLLREVHSMEWVTFDEEQRAPQERLEMDGVLPSQALIVEEVIVPDPVLFRHEGRIRHGINWAREIPGRLRGVERG